MSWLPFILVCCGILVLGWRLGSFLDDCYQQWKQDRES